MRVYVSFVCRYVAPLVRVITKIIFHRRMWYRAISLRCARIRGLGIIPIPQATSMPVSFAASAAELAHEEKSRTQSITHSPSLFDAPGTK